MARQLLVPSAATNEGSRLLRELLRRRTFGAIARVLRCDERTVRFWARETSKPSLVMRARCFEHLAIPEKSWDDPPSSDLYAGAEPETTRVLVQPATTRRA